MDYIQPDVCHAGGILELKKIGVLAETYRVKMAPHNPQSYVSTHGVAARGCDHAQRGHSGIHAEPDRLGRRNCSKAPGPKIRTATPNCRRARLGVALNEKVAARIRTSRPTAPNTCSVMGR